MPASSLTDLKLRLKLFPAREKRHERSPDYSGKISVPDDQVSALIQYLQQAPRDEFTGRDGVVRRSVALNVSTWQEDHPKWGQCFNGIASPPYTQGQQSENGLPGF